MKSYHLIAILLCLFISGAMLVHAQDMDTEISKLTEDLAGKITKKQCKKVSVVDFTDLENNSSELGKYVADQMTVDFAMNDRSFSVLDRAHLKSIMDEHKLTASGLVDPANAKQLGMLAGVDALIFGKVITIGNEVSVTVQIISTDTGMLITGDKTKFKNDTAVQQPASKPPTPAAPAAGGFALDVARPADTGEGTKPPDLSDDKPQVVKLFGDLRVEVRSLKRISNSEYQLTMVFANQSKRSSIWVALSSDSPAIITDPNGFQYRANMNMYNVSGVQFGAQLKSFFGTHDDSNNKFNPATQIEPNDSIPVTVKFDPNSNSPAQAGICNLQMGILIGHDFDRPFISVSVKNLMTKISAE